MDVIIFVYFIFRDAIINIKYNWELFVLTPTQTQSRLNITETHFSDFLKFKVQS